MNDKLCALDDLANKIYFFLIGKICRLLYTSFEIHIKVAIPKEYKENGRYVISEPFCPSCNRYLKNYVTHLAI